MNKKILVIGIIALLALGAGQAVAANKQIPSAVFNHGGTEFGEATVLTKGGEITEAILHGNFARFGEGAPGGVRQPITLDSQKRIIIEGIQIRPVEPKRLLVAEKGSDIKGLRGSMDIKEVFREADGSTVPLEIDSTDGSLYADGVKYKIGEAKEIDPEAKGSTPISGSVSAGTYDSCGPIYLSAGEWVSVAINHNPPNVDVLLGFVNSNGIGEGIIDYDHNGVASFWYQAPATDYYYANVGAQGGGFSYQGYITW